ncbi:hypothetical protein MRX96_003918 [Rhipicephalus microplus]
MWRPPRIDAAPSITHRACSGARIANVGALVFPDVPLGSSTKTHTCWLKKRTTGGLRLSCEALRVFVTVSPGESFRAVSFGDRQATFARRSAAAALRHPKAGRARGNAPCDGPVSPPPR